MNRDHNRGQWRELGGEARQTTGLAGRVVVVPLLLLTTTMGCSLLQGGRERHPPQPQNQGRPPSATSAAGAHPSIVLGSATGAPGQDVTLVATLQAAGARVAGTQNDLRFDAVNVSMGSSGKPSCRVNAAINKGATAFAFLPSGCRGTACTAARALVVAVDNTDPIPDGAALYTCILHISPSAPPGQYHISISGVILSTSAGKPVANAGGGDGLLIVSGARQ